MYNKKKQKDPIFHFITIIIQLSTETETKVDNSTRTILLVEQLSGTIK